MLSMFPEHILHCIVESCLSNRHVLFALTGLVFETTTVHDSWPAKSPYAHLPRPTSDAQLSSVIFVSVENTLLMRIAPIKELLPADFTVSLPTKMLSSRFLYFLAPVRKLTINTVHQ